MKVRLSIANLVPHAKNTDNGEEFFFGIMYRSALRKNIKRLISLGGAANMTDLGKLILETQYQAEMTNGMDARFIVDDQHVEEILSLFKQRDLSFYEIGARREVIEELTEESLPPILDTPPFTVAEVADINASYVKTVVQGHSDRQSLLEVAGVPTIRMFNLFTLSGPSAFLDKLKISPAFRVVTHSEVERTMSGERLYTSDGVEIGDNIIW